MSVSHIHQVFLSLPLPLNSTASNDCCKTLNHLHSTLIMPNYLNLSSLTILPYHEYSGRLYKSSVNHLSIKDTSISPSNWIEQVKLVSDDNQYKQKKPLHTTSILRVNIQIGARIDDVPDSILCSAFIISRLTRTGGTNSDNRWSPRNGFHNIHTSTFSRNYSGAIVVPANHLRSWVTNS